jgi:transposase-like protein
MLFSTLTPRQSRAIECLLTADSVTEAARQAGVGRTTLYAWMKEPRFQAALAESRRAGHHARLNQLRRLVPEALGSLEWLLRSTNEWVRLGAVRETLRAYGSLLPDEDAASALASDGDEEAPALTILDKVGDGSARNGSYLVRVRGSGGKYDDGGPALEEVLSFASEIAGERLDMEAALRSSTMDLLTEALLLDPTGQPALVEFQERALEQIEVLREAGGMGALPGLSPSKGAPAPLASLPSPSSGESGPGAAGAPNGGVPPEGDESQ